MEPVQHVLQILKRTTRIEAAMRAPGGVRITEERELLAMRVWLNRHPSLVENIHDVARTLSVPVQALSVEDLEHVASS